MADEQQLYLSLHSEDVDGEEMAQLMRRLRRELLEIDIEGAEFAKGDELPEGAKSLGAIDWNTLIVGVVATSSILANLIMVFNSWVQRNPETELTLTLRDGAVLHIKGPLPPGTELHNRAMDILQLAATQQPEDQTFANDPSLATLRQKMNDHLKLDDVKTIYFDLLLDYEQFGGESLNKNGKIQLLLKHCHRTGRIAEVRKVCKRLNPHVDWEE